MNDTLLHIIVAAVVIGIIALLIVFDEGRIDH